MAEKYQLVPGLNPADGRAIQSLLSSFLNGPLAGYAVDGDMPPDAEGRSNIIVWLSEALAVSLPRSIPRLLEVYETTVAVSHRIRFLVHHGGQVYAVPVHVAEFAALAVALLPAFKAMALKYSPPQFDTAAIAAPIIEKWCGEKTQS